MSIEIGEYFRAPRNSALNPKQKSSNFSFRLFNTLHRVSNGSCGDQKLQRRLRYPSNHPFFGSLPPLQLSPYIGRYIKPFPSNRIGVVHFFLLPRAPPIVRDWPTIGEWMSLITKHLPSGPMNHFWLCSPPNLTMMMIAEWPKKLLFRSPFSPPFHVQIRLVPELLETVGLCYRCCCRGSGNWFSMSVTHNLLKDDKSASCSIIKSFFDYDHSLPWLRLFHVLMRGHNMACDFDWNINMVSLWFWLESTSAINYAELIIHDMFWLLVSIAQQPTNKNGNVHCRLLFYF